MPPRPRSPLRWPPLQSRCWARFAALRRPPGAPVSRGRPDVCLSVRPAPGWCCWLASSARRNGVGRAHRRSHRWHPSSAGCSRVPKNPPSTPRADPKTRQPHGKDAAPLLPPQPPPLVLPGDISGAQCVGMRSGSPSPSSSLFLILPSVQRGEVGSPSSPFPASSRAHGHLKAARFCSGAAR